MKNLKLIIIFSILIFSKINKAVSQNTPKNVPFYSEFIVDVPELKVPYEVNCGFEKLTLTEEERDKLRPFTPAGYEVIGKLPINPNFNLLIFGELIGNKYVPYLFVTDKEGMGDSNQILFGNDCNSDSSYEYKYIISTISYNQIVVTEIKVSKNSQAPNQETKTIFEINKKGKIEKRK